MTMPMIIALAVTVLMIILIMVDKLPLVRPRCCRCCSLLSSVSSALLTRWATPA